jgi:hypothetical protein
MKELEIIAISCLLILSGIFYVVRKRIILYHVLCASAVAAFIFMSSRYVGASPNERILLICGLGLYWFGLTVFRIILNRSVSLNLLASLRDGLLDNTVKEDIAGRLKDAQHYRLVSVVNETYHLTWFGRILALVITIAYHVFRIEK